MKRKQLTFYIGSALLIAAGVYYVISSNGPRSMDVETIATVNGKPLKLQDFQERLSTIKMNYPPDQKLDLKKIKSRVLRRMIIEALILQEADNKKLQISSEELSRYIRNLKQNYTEADFNQMLNNQFKTYDDWVTDVKRKLLIEKTLSKEVTEKVNVTDKEIKEYYDKNYNGKTIAAKIKLAQIFTATKATAEQAMAELKEGKPFEEVAKKFSQSPEATNGGVIGYIKKGEGIQIFDKGFDMKPLENSEITQSDYGFHILRILEYIPSTQFTLDKAKQSIISELAREKETKQYENWLSDNLKTAKIYKNTALLESVK
jgi:parvulin-like peptidyl-prolyl isomerase